MTSTMLHLALRRATGCQRQGAARLLCSSSTSPPLPPNPLEVISSATASLESFSARLTAVGKVAGSDEFRETVILGCRDADDAYFADENNRRRRDKMLPVAEELEQEMKAMAEEFVSSVSPKMSAAAQVCQQTPCGGMSFLAEKDEWDGAKIDGKDTPCGKLFAASQDFMELMKATRPDVELGSRAACFLRLARDHQAPIASVIAQGPQMKAAVVKTFNTEKVATPWLRPETEDDKEGGGAGAKE